MRVRPLIQRNPATRMPCMLRHSVSCASGAPSPRKHLRPREVEMNPDRIIWPATVEFYPPVPTEGFAREGDKRMIRVMALAGIALAVAAPSTGRHRLAHFLTQTA